MIEAVSVTEGHKEEMRFCDLRESSPISALSPLLRAFIRLNRCLRCSLRGRDASPQGRRARWRAGTA